MSTLAYAALTQKREEALPGSSTSSQPPGVRPWVDALTSLVPAEVLALHAVIVTAVTTEDKGVAIVTELATASKAFYGLVLLAIAFYIAGRLSAKTWDRWDFLRMLIREARLSRGPCCRRRLCSTRCIQTWDRRRAQSPRCSEPLSLA